jgi:perosamine synthetase
LLHNQPVFRNDGTIVCKKAESLAAAHISLPIHMLISENDAEYIAVQLAGLLDA